MGSHTPAQTTPESKRSSPPMTSCTLRSTNDGTIDTFPCWQPAYAAHQIATFPITANKKPAIRGYGRVGLPGSYQLAAKFRNAGAFGFMCGTRNRVSIVDCDSTDERILADAISDHGPTPLIVRTASGKYHAYYRHNGERRQIRPWPGKPIDVLGARGLAVAPPSVTPHGHYQIVQGSLDDLDRLPVMRGLDEGFYQSDSNTNTNTNTNTNSNTNSNTNGEPRTESIDATVGRRNISLFRHCMREAHSCENLDQLLAIARSLNLQWQPSLPDDEVKCVVDSVWNYTSTGRNRFGQFGAWFTIAECDFFLLEHGAVMQDVFILLAFLRAHQGPNATFMITNSLAEKFGWSRKRLASARAMLVDMKQIRRCRGAVANTAALYQWDALLPKGGESGEGGC
jgi:hypothetical protein